MRRLKSFAATCWLFVVAAPSPVLAGDADNSPGCVLPVFGADRAAIIEACGALLAQSKLDDAERARILKIRGRTLHFSHKIGPAIRDIEEAIKLAPNDPELRVRRGKIALTRREFDTGPLNPLAFASAVDFAKQALAIDPNYWGAYDLLGMTLTLVNNFGPAKSAYDKAIALDPNNVVPRLHRFYFYKTVVAFDAAIKELDALLQMPAKELDTEFTTIRNKEVSFRTMARLERAALLVAMGRFEDAEKAYADWIAVEPGAVSYGWRALFHMQRPQFGGAQSDLDKALSYDPGFWFLHNLQGNVYFYAEQYERSIQSFTNAIAEYPGSGLNYWGRALALRALKRNDEAGDDAVKALTDPDFPNRVIDRVTKSGYFKVGASETDMMPALRDAVRACMLDERC